ncbi:MAG: alpha-ketoacid dehydrogenase subunit beta [Dehalococcoidia bacterium]
MPETRYVRAIADTLAAEMERNERVIVIGQDIAAAGGTFGATRGLVERFGPERVRDAPISEIALVGGAIGAALNGLRPVVEIMFMDFLGTCWDQVVNQMAKLRYMAGGEVAVPLVLRTHMGAGMSAGPQHSGSYEAWAVHIPGLKVVMPATPADVKGLLTAAIRDDNPVLVVENKALYASRGSVPDGDYVLPIGEAAVLREGSDVTVVGLSRYVGEALRAAETLAAEGIQIEVIDPRSLSPFDAATVVRSVEKTGHLVVAHEGWGPCGFGAEVLAQVVERCPGALKAARRITPPFCPTPFSPALEAAWLPNSGAIVTAVREVVGR